MAGDRVAGGITVDIVDMEHLALKTRATVDSTRTVVVLEILFLE
jgi:hypothetical protein